MAAVFGVMVLMLLVSRAAAIDSLAEPVVPRSPCKGVDQFYCTAGGVHHTCLEKHWVCNGVGDCIDQEDEEEDMCRHYHEQNDCTENEFECSTTLQCLPISFLCDGSPDCGSGEDEIGCPKKSHDCTANQFQCRDEQKCLSLIFLCDGRLDCFDGSDEEDCKCDSDSHFTCSDGKRCPSLAAVCDGRFDCRDKSDEGGRCVDGNCSLACTNGDCFRTPAGPKCQCYPGFREHDGICNDVDECREEAKCDHYCSNQLGNYSCTCHQGYFLHDREMCRALGDDSAILIYSYRSDVRYLELKNMKEHEVFSGQASVISVAYDSTTNHVYWSDHAGVVSRRSLNGKGKVEVITKKDIGVARSIAMDWIGRNIYLADKKKGKMVVCNVDNFACKSLFNENVIATSIQLDLNEKQMYWTDDDQHMIFRSNMDGSSKITIAQNNLTWPNALALDVPSRKLYWMDAKRKTLEQFDLRDSSRKIISGVKLEHPFSMAVWEDKLYWSDWETKEIISAHKTDGSGQVGLLDHNYAFHGISVFHEQMLKDSSDSENPCHSARCSHLCLLRKKSSGRDSFVCACPEELELSSDSRNCIETDVQPSLAVAKGPKIYNVQWRKYSDPEIKIMVKDEFKMVSDMEYDPTNKNLYVSDRLDGKIKKINLVTKKITTIITGCRQLSGIAVDWSRNNIYWVDSFFKTLEVATLDGHFRTTLKLDSECKAQDVAIHDETGQLVLACASPNSRIISCTRNGSPCTVLDSGVKIPGGLAIDHQNIAAGTQESWVYWSDSYHQQVGRCSLDDGTKRVYKVDNPSGLEVSAGTMYLTKQGVLTDVYTRNVSGSEYFKSFIVDSSIEDSDHRVSRNHMALTTINWPIYKHSLSYSYEMFCKTAKCDQLCLENHLKHPVCACSSAHQLSSDGRSCVNKECSADFFRCNADKKCIPIIHICNNIRDCEDGSDESSLTCRKCTEESFRCGSLGECVDKKRVCDGEKDCKDGSDEENCLKPSCLNGFSQCADGDGCYLNGSVCDGYPDCKDSSDEKDCRSCYDNEFKCGHGKEACLPKLVLCNGTPDCIDGSDEENCTRSCQDTEFQCQSDGSCVANFKICDTHIDCPAGEDELQDCQKPVSVCSPEGGSCQLTCLEHQFRCNSGKQCIEDRFYCDGESHCEDESDEVSCSSIYRSTEEETRNCDRGQFDCGDNECVEQTQVCNAVLDCSNGADEDSDCSTSCIDNGGCQHMCRGGVQPWHCYCHRGYRLHEDGKHCVDSNECEQSDPCEQECYNTAGGFTCSCAPGYWKARDAVSCFSHSGSNIIGMSSGRKLNYLGGLANASGSVGTLNSESIDKIVFNNVKRQIISLSAGTIGVIDPITLRWSPLFGGLQNPTAIAMDGPGQNYYVGQQITSGESQTALLTACSIRNVGCKSIFEEDAMVLSDVVVAESERKLFFCLSSNIDSKQSKIFQSRLDGSKKIAIINRKMRKCSHLALDEPKKLIYWADPILKQIGRADWSGHNMDIYKSLDAEVLSLVVSGFWVMWLQSNQLLQRCHKHSSRQCSAVHLKEAAVAMVSMPGAHGAESQICRPATCSSLCFTVDDDHVCACEDDKAPGCSMPQILNGISSCDPDPCLPGEVCMLDDVNGYLCSCLPGGESANCYVDDDIAFVKPLIWALVILALSAAAAGLYYYYKRPLFIFKRKETSGKAQVRFSNPAFGAPKDEIDSTLRNTRNLAAAPFTVPLQPALDPNSLVEVQIHQPASEEQFGEGDHDRSRGRHPLV